MFFQPSYRFGNAPPFTRWNILSMSWLTNLTKLLSWHYELEKSFHCECFEIVAGVIEFDIWTSMRKFNVRWFVIPTCYIVVIFILWQFNNFLRYTLLSNFSNYLLFDSLFSCYMLILCIRLKLRKIGVVIFTYIHCMVNYGIVKTDL